MKERVGTCSICGGDVMGYRGAWYGTIPPGPDKCSSCGAVTQSDVIQMTPTHTEFYQPVKLINNKGEDL